MLPRTKSLLLPAAADRRLPFGIGRGLNLRVDFMHMTRLYLGMYEVELNRHLRRFTRAGYRSFDVGGHYGYDALVLAKLTKAPVVTFEAEPEFGRQLTHNTTLNPELHHLVKLVVGRVGSHHRPSDGVVSLDGFACEPDGFVPDLVKIDIEGAELAALDGARTILSGRRPHLLIETHSAELELECGRLLVEHGYSPTIVHQRGFAPGNRPAEHNRWLVAEGAVGSHRVAHPRPGPEVSVAASS